MASLVILLLFVARSCAQSCTSDPSVGVKAEYGLTASRGPPVPVDHAVHLSCPGAKSFDGKSSWRRVCQNDNTYKFDPVLVNWPVCECWLDVTKYCPQAISYNTSYADTANTPGTKLLLAPPPNTIDWHIVLQMDMPVGGMLPIASNAQLVVDGNGEYLHLSRHPDAKMEDDDTLWVEVDYKDLSLGVFRWEQPCIAKINCTFEVGDEHTNKKLWIVIGVAAAAIVTVMILCFCICYCLKNCCGDDPKTWPISRVDSAASSNAVNQVYGTYDYY